MPSLDQHQMLNMYLDVGAMSSGAAPRDVSNALGVFLTKAMPDRRGIFVSTLSHAGAKRLCRL